MPELLTSRNGTWHFVRRVPAEFAHIDRRGIIKHSTKIRVASDRLAPRATRVAERLNEELELTWRRLSGDQAALALRSEERNARRSIIPCPGARTDFIKPVRAFYAAMSSAEFSRER